MLLISSTGSSLAKKLDEAVKYAAKQSDVLAAFSASNFDPSDVIRMKNTIAAWESNPESATSPFLDQPTGTQTCTVDNITNANTIISRKEPE